MMKTFTFKLALTAIAASFLLSACGGGGGGDSAPSPAPAPAPAPAATPAAAPVPPAISLPSPPPIASIPAGFGPAVRAYTLADLPTSTYLAGSPEKAMFDTLNKTRVGGGFGGIEQNAAIDKAAKAHATYVLKNFVSINGVDSAASGVQILPDGTIAIHAEVAGKVGFTGVRVKDRLAAQGYSSLFDNENVAFSIGKAPGEEPSVTSCLTDLVNSVFHRATLLSSLYREIGFAVSDSVLDANGYKTKACVINFASNQLPPAFPSDFAGIYPVAGQTGLALSMSLERPDPAPEFSVKGYPLSFQGAFPTTLTVTKFELRDANAALVATKLLTRAQTLSLSPNEAYLVPNGALKQNAVYFATFTGISGVVPVSKSWSFTTGAN